MDEELRAAIAETKQRLREAIGLRRSVRDADEAAAADEARTRLVAEFLGPRLHSELTAACYLSRPGEPGTLAIIALLQAAGARVLLPAFDAAPPPIDTTGGRRGGAPGRLPNPRWAWYAGPDELTTGPHGILQPSTPALSPPILGRAEVIICPGLAGTPAGERLGTGGGWYDRALPWADPAAATVLLLNEDEVLDSLPTEPTDERIDVIITEERAIATRG
ncbi:5-formyltetrahydrofolate cyclo-ligase [Naumannella cuiyingiana]|uniref:5-formyltetrahydrofolate cyclo-ligase n=1 Tax=Naumannella cuiyingiana TaxID=1347891 RepID=A0A7Z0ILN2_9ACTN|nr:5-formyltetrahydrofolate cyclo-ligase [Naumannella cuiyingiana]